MYKYLKSEIKAKRKYKLMNKSWLYIYLHMCTYFTTMYKKHSVLYVYLFSSVCIQLIMYTTAP